MIFRLFTMGLLLLFSADVSPALAGPDIAQIKTLQGEVHVVRDGKRFAVEVGELLQQADVIETGAAGSVGITFIDSSQISAGPDSRIALSQFRFNPTTHEGGFTTDVQRGTLTVISGQIAKKSPEAMKIVTPTTILGFRGTRVAVKVTE